MRKGKTSRKAKVYLHYKGNKYKLLYLAKHSETLEDLVVYQALYGKMQVWVRPKKMFFEKVLVEGKKVPRFRHIKEV